MTDFVNFSKAWSSYCTPGLSKSLTALPIARVPIEFAVARTYRNVKHTPIYRLNRSKSSCYQ